MTTTWTNSNKTASSWSNNSKSASEIVYLVSEALDYYLVGSAEDETLIAQGAINWANLAKS